MSCGLNAFPPVFFFKSATGKYHAPGKSPLFVTALKSFILFERVASPGAYLVDIFPIMMHLPDWLAPFKREGNRLHKRELEFYTNLLDDVRREVQQGNAPRTIATTMLDRQAEFGFSDVEAAYTLGAMYIAAAGTTSATMMSFCLAMCRLSPMAKATSRRSRSGCWSGSATKL